MGTIQVSPSPSPAPTAEAASLTSPATITPTCLGLQLIALEDSIREAFAIIEYVLVAVVLANSIAVSVCNKCC